MREWEWKRVCLLWKQFFFFPCRLPDKISGTPWGFPYTSLIEIKGSVRRTLDIKIIFFKKRQKLVIFFCIITSSLCLYFPVVSYSSLQFVENKNQRRFIHYVWLICLLNFNLLVILFFFLCNIIIEETGSFVPVWFISFWFSLRHHCGII